MVTSYHVAYFSYLSICDSVIKLIYLLSCRLHGDTRHLNPTSIDVDVAGIVRKNLYQLKCSR